MITKNQKNSWSMGPDVFWTSEREKKKSTKRSVPTG